MHIRITIQHDIPTVAHSARGSFEYCRKGAQVLHQNGIGFKSDISAVSASTSFCDVGPNASKWEIVKVLGPDNLYIVRLYVDTTVLNARSGITRYICFKDRRILDHCVLVDDDINAATNLFYSICDGARTGDVGGNRRVVQDKLAASNRDSPATIAADVND